MFSFLSIHRFLSRSSPSSWYKFHHRLLHATLSWSISGRFSCILQGKRPTMEYTFFDVDRCLNNRVAQFRCDPWDHAYWSCSQD